MNTLSFSDVYWSIPFQVCGVLMFLFGWYFSVHLAPLFHKKEKPNDLVGSKDPNDFTKTNLSTNWKTVSVYCKKCKSDGSHNEFMADVCNSCGSFFTMKLNGKSWRKIYIDGKWKYQVKYANGSIEIKDEY
jgi:hypothetical protein